MTSHKEPKLGSGKRFSNLQNSVEDEYKKKGMSAAKAKEVAGAVAASAGRKKYGADKMAHLSVVGAKRAGK